MGKKILAALASRTGIFINTAVITLLSLVIVGEEFLNDAHQGSVMLTLQTIGLQDDLSLIFVAFGVFLEERGLLLSRALGAAADSVLEESRNDDAETAGAYLLMIGLLMEVIDQTFDLILHVSPLAGQGLSLLVGFLNLLALFLLFRLIKQVLFDWSAQNSA